MAHSYVQTAKRTARSQDCWGIGKKQLLEIGITTIVLVLFWVSLSISATLKIDRAWSENDFGYALVSYENDSKTTFKYYVTVQCTAFDSEGGKININKRSFFTHEYGPIFPGFKGTLKIPIQLDGGEMEEVSCGYIEK